MESPAATAGSLRALMLLCCLCLVLCAGPASARLASVPIDDLIARSDAIVIATVAEVSPGPASLGELVYAKAVVQQTLKGSLTGAFSFRASPTWVCDISSAVKDEVALFFLMRQSDGTFALQHAGRGRMPFRKVAGKNYVTVWDEVRLPGSAPTIAGPDSRYDFIVSVELAYVETLIRKYRTASAL